jgi:hypothetical protein
MCVEGSNLAGTNLMGDGNTDTRRNIKSNAHSARICGAMAEQRRADGSNQNESTPQQFLHLIGCRDPNASRGQWEHSRSTVRTRSTARKA